MDNRDDIKYCGKTKKYCYTSEAKAQRSLNAYEQIKRVYHCDHCDYWHTTKISGGKAFELGIIEAEERRSISPKRIRKEIRKLKNKLKE